MARVWDSSQWHWERGVSAPSSGASRGQAQVQAGTASLAHAGPHVPARERQRVRVVEGCTAEHFKREVVRTCEPAVLRGLPLGPCLDLWTPEHMMRSGGSKEVSVHVSPHDRMDFITKNFKYHTLAFDELVRRAAYGCDSGEGGVGEELPTVERDGQDFTHALPLRPGAKDIVGKAAANSGSDESPTTAGSPLPAATSVVEKQATATTVEEERSRRRVAAAADAAAAAAAGAAPGGSFMHKDEKYYLRALGSDPRKSVANLTLDFPALAQEIHLEELYDAEHFFSSVLRIGSPGIHLWTHYDVMDNVLAQVTGRKRVVLYPPQDADYMYMVGDKSAVLDIDEPDLVKYPLFRHARGFECFLEPGDVLYIPALWFHNVVSLDFSVAVNVFWRTLPKDCYDAKDTYGNRDPLPANRAMQQVGTMLKSLEALPPIHRDFFARRLVQMIKDKAYLPSDRHGVGGSE